MKRVQVLFIALCTTTFSFAQNKGITFSSASEYNNYIVDKQQEVVQTILAFSAAKEILKKEQIIDAYIPKVIKHLNDIKAMPAFKGNTALRTSSINLFEFYKEALSGSYKRIIDIQKDGVITKEEQKEAQQISVSVNAKETKLDAAFKAAQQQFAAQNNMRIETSDLQKKIDKLKKK